MRKKGGVWVMMTMMKMMDVMLVQPDEDSYFSDIPCASGVSSQNRRDSIKQGRAREDTECNNLGGI